MAEPLVLQIVVDDKGTATIQSFGKQVGSAADVMEHKGAGAARAMTEQTTRLTSSMNSSITTLARFTTGLLGISVGSAAIVKMVSSISGFEAAMANVSTLVDTSKISMAGLREELLKLPPELGSSQELAEALYQTLSAGVEPAKAVAFVGDAAKLAKAGLTDATTAVDIMTTALNAYGLKAEDSGRVSDVLFKTVEKGKTTMKELASTLGPAIPLAAQLGVSFEDLNASIATLTAGGLKTATAADAMKSAFASMIQNAAKFRAVGIDVNTVIGEEGLAGLMQRLQVVTGGNAEKIRELVPDVQGLTAVLALSGKQAATFTTNLEAMATAAGATSTAFEKRIQTFEARLETFNNQLDRLTQRSGPALLPFLGKIIEEASEEIDKLGAVLEAVFGLGRAFSTAEKETFKWRSALVATEASIEGLQPRIANFFGLLSPEKIRKTHEEMARIQDVLTNLKGGLDSTALAYEGMGGKIVTAAEKVETANRKASIGTKESWEAAAREMEDTFTQAYEGMTETVEKARLARTVAEELAVITEAYKELGLKAPQELQRVSTAAVTAFATILNSGKASTSDLLKAAVDVATKWKATYGDLPAGLRPAFIQIANNAVQELQRLKNSGTLSADELQERFATLKEQLTTILGKLPPELEPIFRSIAELGGQAAKDIKDAFEENMTAAAKRTREIDEILKNSILNTQFETINTSFASDPLGIKAQIQDFITTIRNVQRAGDQPGFTGSAAFQVEELKRGLDILIRRLAQNAPDELSRLNLSGVPLADETRRFLDSLRPAPPSRTGGGSGGTGGLTGGTGVTPSRPSGGRGFPAVPVGGGSRSGGPSRLDGSIDRLTQEVQESLKLLGDRTGGNVTIQRLDINQVGLDPLHLDAKALVQALSGQLKEARRRGEL